MSHRGEVPLADEEPELRRHGARGRSVRTQREMRGNKARLLPVFG